MDRYPVLADTRPARRIYADEAPPPRRSRLMPWWAGLGLLLLTGSAFISWFALNPPGAGAGAGPTKAAERSQEPRDTFATAHVDVEGGVRYLYPTQHGRIAKLPVAEDEVVEEGTVLLQIDDRLQKAQQTEAEVALEAARERLKQAEQLIKRHQNELEVRKAAVDAASAKLGQARANAADVMRVYNEAKFGSKEKTEAVQRQVEEAEAGVRVEKGKLKVLRDTDPKAAVELARLDVKAKQAQLERANIAVAECQVKAPCQGKILRLLVSAGEVLGPNPRQAALVFCPAGQRIIRAEVEQEFARTLAKGMAAEIRDDVSSRHEMSWAGKVKRISDWFTARRSILLEPTQFNDVRTLEVILSVDDPKHLLRIGQKVSVRLKAGG
jgi:multidrug resistance efflux pump